MNFLSLASLCYNYKMNFWQNLPRPFFALAPMEDVTDAVFRRVILRAGEIAKRENSNSESCHSGQKIFAENFADPESINKNSQKFNENSHKNLNFDKNFSQNFRPDVFFTEFTNAASFCSEKGEFSTRGRLIFSPNEQPIVAQIWGKNPENFREMTRECFARGFAGVDINMGCPDKSVVKNGCGSALIENPNLAISLIRAAKKGFEDFLKLENSAKFDKNFDNFDNFDNFFANFAQKSNNEFSKNQVQNFEKSQFDENQKLCDEIYRKNSAKNRENNRESAQILFPISVKTRLGARKTDEFLTWIPQILNEQIANLTVHLRTRKEMSKVAAHFELIPEILKMRGRISPATKITINGDIFTKEIAREIREKYFYKNEITGEILRIDGFMIGRGIFQNPFVFANFENPTRENLFELLHFHLDEFDKFNKKARENSPILQRKFDPLKRFFKIYVKDFASAKELREKMFSAKNTDEVRGILREFEKSEKFEKFEKIN